jgi:Cu2+-exporting ATPase
MSAGQKTITLSIEGMMCEKCENKVKTALLQTPGVESAVVSYEAGTAVVAYADGAMTRKNSNATSRRPA